MLYSVVKQTLLGIGATCAQWILSATFLFSGFVKVLDPRGMEYKLEAYLQSFAFPFEGYELYLKVCVVALAIFEFMLGVYLLLGMRKRFATIGVFVFLLAMTALTVYVYVYSPVPDCGCFGDALVLTHTQTLFKNIILLLCASFLLFQRRRALRIISEHNQWLLSVFALGYTLILALYTYRHLPLLEFTGFDVGTDISEALIAKFENTYWYRKSGRERAFMENTLPDSTWQFVRLEQREITPARIQEFSIYDLEGEDLSERLLTDTSFVFLVVAPDLSKADVGCSDALNDLYDYSSDTGKLFYCVTSSEDSAITSWTERTGAAYPFARASSEMLKAAVRSEPGLLLLSRGKIIGKWSSQDIPTEAEILAVANTPLVSVTESQRQHVLTLLLWFVVPFAFMLLADRIWMGTRFYKVYVRRKLRL